MALKRLRLFKGDTLTGLVESFIGFTDLAIPTPSVPAEARYSGASVLVANNGNDLLPWTNLAAGADLLDRTDPLVPRFLDDGVYALTLLVGGDPLTVGGVAYVVVGYSAFGNLAAAESAHPGNAFGPAATIEAQAGGQLTVSLVNQDGVAARNFAIGRAVLVKL